MAVDANPGSFSAFTTWEAGDKDRKEKNVPTGAFKMAMYMLNAASFVKDACLLLYATDSAYLKHMRCGGVWLSLHTTTPTKIVLTVSFITIRPRT